jgi:hypothetical protein
MRAYTVRPTRLHLAWECHIAVCVETPLGTERAALPVGVVRPNAMHIDHPPSTQSTLARAQLRSRALARRNASIVHCIMAQGASLGGAAAPVQPDEPSPYFQRWALQTLAGGAAGATYGSLSAYLASQPMTFYASAYGTNTAIFTGSFLALRHALYAVASPATARDRAAITGVAGAAVGGLFTGIVSGPRKVPLGALLWAAGCAGGQVALDRWSDFRSVRAGAILRQRAQWAQLSAEEQAAYHELTARARSGRLAVSSLPGSGEAHRGNGPQ